MILRINGIYFKVEGDEFSQIPEPIKVSDYVRVYNGMNYTIEQVIMPAYKIQSYNDMLNTWGFVTGSNRYDTYQEAFAAMRDQFMSFHKTAIYRIIEE